MHLRALRTRCDTTRRGTRCACLKILAILAHNSHICVHHSAGHQEALRSWRFEGSSDGGATWSLLHEAADDATLSAKGLCGTWTVPAAASVVRAASQAQAQAHSSVSASSASVQPAALLALAHTKFRVQMTAPNSNKNWYMALCGLELYGYLAVSEPSAAPSSGSLKISATATATASSASGSATSGSGGLSASHKSAGDAHSHPAVPALVQLGMPPNAAWFEAVVMLEQTILALRPAYALSVQVHSPSAPASAASFSAASTCVPSASNSVTPTRQLPLEFARHVWRAVQAWPSERAAIAASSSGSAASASSVSSAAGAVADDVGELQELHSAWSETADEQLVRAVNMRCEKRNVTADSLTAETVRVLSRP